MIIILLLTVIALEVITFYKLNKKIMGAEAKLDELLVAIGEVITTIETAFTGTGDLTEAEVDAKVNPILERLRAIVPPPIEG